MQLPQSRLTWTGSKWVDLWEVFSTLVQTIWGTVLRNPLLALCLPVWKRSEQLLVTWGFSLGQAYKNIHKSFSSLYVPSPTWTCMTTLLFLGTLVCAVRYKVEEATSLMPLLHKKNYLYRYSQCLFKATPGGEVWVFHHQGNKCLLGESQTREAGYWRAQESMWILYEFCGLQTWSRRHEVWINQSAVESECNCSPPRTFLWMHSLTNDVSEPICITHLGTWFGRPSQWRQGWAQSTT